MKMLEPKMERFWWGKKPVTLLYFIREINGILLGLTALALIAYIIIFNLLPTFQFNLSIYGIILNCFFVSSVIHSLTWFIALPKILPFTLSENGQKIVTIVLITFWILISLLIINLLYTR